MYIYIYIYIYDYKFTLHFTQKYRQKDTEKQNYMIARYWEYKITNNNNKYICKKGNCLLYKRKLLVKFGFTDERIYLNYLKCFVKSLS